MAKRKSRILSGQIGDVKYDAMSAIYGYMKRNGVNSVVSSARGATYDLRIAETKSGDRTIEVAFHNVPDVWTDISNFAVEAIVGLLMDIEESLGIEDE